MRTLSERRGSITPAQRGYLCALYREAFKNLYTMRASDLRGCDMAHVDMFSMYDASFYIGRLVAAKARGWTVAA